MNGDVTIKTKDGVIVRIPYTTIKKIKLPSKPEDTTTDIPNPEIVKAVEKKNLPTKNISPTK